MDQEFIRKFYSKDLYREEMLSTIYDGNGYAYATDASVLLRWKSEGAKNAKLNCAAIFENVEKKQDYFTFNMSLFAKKKKALPLIQDNKECHCCDGEKQVAWQFESYEMYDDCPRCDGDGVIKNSDKMVENKKGLVNFQGNNISISVAEKVVECLLQVGKKQVNVMYNKGHSQLYADFKDFDLIFMSTIAND